MDGEFASIGRRGCIEGTGQFLLQGETLTHDLPFIMSTPSLFSSQDLRSLPALREQCGAAVP